MRSLPLDDGSLLLLGIDFQPFPPGLVVVPFDLRPGQTVGVTAPVGQVKAGVDDASNVRDGNLQDSQLLLEVVHLPADGGLFFTGDIVRNSSGHGLIGPSDPVLTELLQLCGMRVAGPFVALVSQS